MALRVSALPGNGRAAHASVTEGAARAGLTARGAVYLLVGVLALQIAFGDGRRQAGRGGALAELAGKPFGAVLLWALGVGLVGMALWRLSEVVFGAPGGDGRSWRKRLAGRARCVFYAVVAFSVLSFAAGERGGSAGAPVMSSPGTRRPGPSACPAASGSWPWRARAWSSPECGSAPGP